jgi:hypothetical protein
MNARKVAAQFAAQTWYEECRVGKQSVGEARRFAKENWNAFLPVVHDGLGELLIRIASARSKQRRLRRLRTLSLAAAS